MSRGSGEENEGGVNIRLKDPPLQSTELPLKPLDIFETLNSYDVKFVVIGGYSLSAHSLVRATKDVDVVPAPGKDNLEKLLRALSSMDAKPLTLEEFQANEMMELNLENLLLEGKWLLSTKFGRLDVMQYVEGAPGYEALAQGAKNLKLREVAHPVSFAGYEDLISMKSASARDQDLQDIVELERINQEKINQSHS